MYSVTFCQRRYRRPTPRSLLLRRPRRQARRCIRTLATQQLPDARQIGLGITRLLLGVVQSLPSPSPDGGGPEADSVRTCGSRRWSWRPTSFPAPRRAIHPSVKARLGRLSCQIVPNLGDQRGHPDCEVPLLFGDVGHRMSHQLLQEGVRPLIQERRECEAQGTEPVT